MIQRSLLLATLLVVACGEGEGGHGHTGSGAACPQVQMLTYESFGRAFLDRYCNGCHAKTVAASARAGAPSDLDFDTIADVRVHGRTIDEHAAAGPSATNTAMPPRDPRPTLAERQQLAEWLACGAP